VVDDNPIFFINSNSLEAKSDGKDYFVEGYVATGDLDLGNDIITKACLDDIFRQFEEKTLKLDFEHESLRGKTPLEAEANLSKMPLGRRVTWARDEKGVKIGWKLNPAWKQRDDQKRITMSFKDVWGSIEDKFYDGFSIGYIPTKTETIVLSDGTRARELQKMKMLTSALTGTPMNSGATMTRAFAKSLEFMKEREQKSNSQLGDIMTDKQETKTDKVEETKVTETKSEENTENLIEFKSKIETLEKESTEIKSELAEVKSQNTELKSQIETLGKDNAELKSVMEKARQKAISQTEVEQKEMKSKIEPEEKSLVGKVINFL